MRLAALLLILSSASLAQAQEGEPVPEPPEPVELRPATVRFRGNVDELRVHYLADPVLDDDDDGGLVIRRAAESSYPLLCDAPCDRELPQGHFGLAIGRGDRLVRFLEPLGVDGPTGVRLRWTDQSDLRLAGILTLAIGIPLALGVGLVPLAAEASGSGIGDATTVGLVVGAPLLAAAVVIGAILVVSEDGASFSAEPLPADASGLYSSEWE